MPYWREQGEYRNCGQIAVAILTDKSVEEVEKLIGHKHGTKTKELALALHKYNYRSPTRRARSNKMPDKHWRGIIHTRHNGQKRGGHWIAVYDGTVFDGCSRGPMTVKEYAEQLALTDWRITAVLPVW